MDTLFVEVRADMRITKTSAQAKAEKEARKQAEEQTKVCPECGETRSFGISYIDLINPRTFGKNRRYYKCHCRTCGCEWVTDEWKES